MSEYIPHNQRPGEKLIAFIVILIVLCGMLSCCGVVKSVTSPEARAYRKIERAYKISPDLYRKAPKIEVKTVDKPPINLGFNCLDAIDRGEMTFIYNEETGAFTEATNDDNGQESFRLQVDSLGNVIAQLRNRKDSVTTVYEQVPIPVEKPLTDWQKFKIAFPYVLGTTITIGLILLFVWLARKFFNITSIIK